MLYSDTLTGAFCAALLCRLASEKWEVGPVDWAFKPKPVRPPAIQRIGDPDAIRVEGLSEEVADPQGCGRRVHRPDPGRNASPGPTSVTTPSSTRAASSS